MGDNQGPSETDADNVDEAPEREDRGVAPTSTPDEDGSECAGIDDAEEVVMMMETGGGRARASDVGDEAEREGDSEIEAEDAAVEADMGWVEEVTTSRSRSSMELALPLMAGAPRRLEVDLPADVNEESAWNMHGRAWPAGSSLDFWQLGHRQLRASN